jgi:ferric-chelate reductase [NAD(P)H]
MDAKAIQKITYGMYIICSKKAGRINGQVANTVFQAASNPALIAISLNKENLTHEFVTDSKVFTVSILSKETPMKFIGQFGFKSGRDHDKFRGCRYQAGLTGAPVALENSIAYFEAEVVSSADVSTHTLFIGKIIEAKVLNDEKPMTYAYYHEVKKGLSPKTAPTYIEK